MVNAYEYLKSLIDGGYFDDENPSKPTGLHRLLAASGALMNTQGTAETILPSQRDELLRCWNERHADADAQVKA